MTEGVQRVGSGPGSQQANPVAEAAGQWREGMQASLNSARMDGAIKAHVRFAQAGYQSLIAPTASGVPIRDLPPDVAMEIVNARGEEINKSLREYGDFLIEQAQKATASALRAEQQAAVQKAQNTKRMLLAAGKESVRRARAFVTGDAPTTARTTTNRPAPRNLPAGVRAAKPSMLAAGPAVPGAGGALAAPSGNLGVVTGRKNRFV